MHDIYLKGFQNSDSIEHLNRINQKSIWAKTHDKASTVWKKLLFLHQQCDAQRATGQKGDMSLHGVQCVLDKGRTKEGVLGLKDYNIWTVSESYVDKKQEWTQNRKKISNKAQTQSLWETSDPSLKPHQKWAQWKGGGEEATLCPIILDWQSVATGLMKVWIQVWI